MRIHLITTALLSLVIPIASQITAYECEGCSIGLGLVQQSPAARAALTKELNKLCGDNIACKAGVALLVGFIEANESPDKICKTLKLCSGQCGLFPKWPLTPPAAPHPDPKPSLQSKGIIGSEVSGIIRQFFHEAASHYLPGHSGFEPLLYAAAFSNRLNGQELPTIDDALPKGVDIEGSKPCGANISCMIDRIANHEPALDGDGDFFASKAVRQLRGSHWRGADCNDFRDDVYPGRRVAVSADVDHDCNGIFGSNSTGAYEDLFCSATERRGVISIGDSATAHFHIPPQYLSPTNWSFARVLPNAADEMDFPQCSWSTGYLHGGTECPYAPRPAALSAGLPSIATRLRLRNRCNHRDFQNLGVNGMRSTAVLPLIDTVARDPATDHKALVIFSLMGNDVCNGHPSTSHMTPPATFKKQILASLAKINTIVPPGSYVIMQGLVDGRVLWNNMNELQHPLGPAYKDVYDFLACMGNSPCNGWLNKNETLRNATSAWATSLNNVYEEIMSETGGKFENFTATYFLPDWNALISNYETEYKRPGSDLIEPSDGFHPSQLGNELLAQQLWAWLEQNFPAAIGDVNPHNDEIQAYFGDQGGF